MYGFREHLSFQNHIHYKMQKMASDLTDAILVQKTKPKSVCQLLLAHLSEALAAVDGTIRLGLKGNLSLATASSANSGEVLTGAAGGILSSVTAGLAALGLILEAALGIELLLASSEHEFLTALFAH